MRINECRIGKTPIDKDTEYMLELLMNDIRVASSEIKSMYGIKSINATLKYHTSLYEYVESCLKDGKNINPDKFNAPHQKRFRGDFRLPQFKAIVIGLLNSLLQFLEKSRDVEEALVELGYHNELLMFLQSEIECEIQKQEDKDEFEFI